MHYEPSYCPYLHGCIKWMLPLLMVFALQPKARPQVAFVDVSDEVNVYSDHTNGYWGTGLSTVDFNGDGYDDITLAHHAGELRFYLGNGTGFEEIAIDLPDYPFEAKAPIWADIDNDGDQDLFVTYRLAANKLYRNNGDLEFIDISQTSGISQASYRSYGACFGDFDKDGLLDLFVANYALGQDPPVNELYKNLGDGLFLDVGSDFVIGEPVTHSFQGQWVDFNEDGLLDLHLIRDRLDFENRYYKQQEGGSFIEDSHAMGLDLAINAMCTSTSDFDRDGDQDLYMSAGMWEGNFFMENEGGEFDEYEAESGDSLAVHLTSWGSCWLDADNNGWEDLHVCTGFSTYTMYPDVFSIYPFVPDHFFWNEAGVFEEDSTGFFETATLSFCAAIADVNADGFPDLVNHAVGEYLQVLQSVPNENNWLRILLQGTTSNRDGVGSKIWVHSGGNAGYRMTHCGENYLSQDSKWEHFGLGSAGSVDSVVVAWPSGIVDVYHDVEVNQSVMLLEGETSATPTGGCLYVGACNFNAAADFDDGTCDFSCLIAELVCGPGLVWDAEAQACQLSCPADLTADGVVNVEDLLVMLDAFASFCP